MLNSLALDLVTCRRAPRRMTSVQYFSSSGIGFVSGACSVFDCTISFPVLFTHKTSGINPGRTLLRDLIFVFAHPIAGVERSIKSDAF